MNLCVNVLRQNAQQNASNCMLKFKQFWRKKFNGSLRQRDWLNCSTTDSNSTWVQSETSRNWRTLLHRRAVYVSCSFTRRQHCVKGRRGRHLEIMTSTQKSDSASRCVFTWGAFPPNFITPLRGATAGRNNNKHHVAYSFSLPVNFLSCSGDL